ncbi:chromosome segregation protein SMC [Candidatus Woesearchaeota archaeon]|nr:chromosome segregation protein SMC [Candidatus Woesearchaeota archaeon]
MTKINKLVLHGFKSFAKRTELIFGNKFNVVLGPNGSGKSNILDAICFVLGRSSSKALRAEKSANLIYNGGKSKKSAAFAEVSIYFDNMDKTFPTEDKEIKITRIVRPNGVSIYKINEEKRTRQEILDLLGLARIDPEGYNIILQGDIVKFVEMSPNDRRMLIEEISGISKYEEKRQKALMELDKVEQKLKESEIILGERENNLKNLKKERDQAAKYQNLNSKIKTNKATFLWRQIEKKQAEKDEFDSRAKKHQERIDKVTKEIHELKTRMAELKEKTDAINKEIEQKGEKEQVDMHKQAEKIRVEIATLKNKTEALKNEIHRINQREEQLQKQKDEIIEKKKSLEFERSELGKQLKSRENERELISRKIDDFRKKHDLQNAAELDKEIEGLDKKADDMQKGLGDLRQQQQDLLREKDRIEFQVQAIDEKMEKVLMLEKENKAQIEDLKQKKKEFKSATLELNQLLNEDSSLSAQLGTARSKTLTINEELSKLRAREMSIKEISLGDTALRKILEQRKSIKGIYGAVSELGEVSSKYSLALEIAAGQKIKGVVVENDAVAARCISYLKDNKLGVATFLPLNKVHGKQADQAAKALKDTSGVHGLAIDLVSHEPKFRGIFSYVFGSTVVVDDIQTARRIGVGTAKMVTLGGDLTELSGAMKGGYRSTKRQGFSFQEKEVIKDISKREKDLEDLERMVSALESRKEENEKRIDRLRQLKVNLEADIIKIEKTLHLDSGDMDVSKKQKKELNDRTGSVDKQMNMVQSKISEGNRSLAELKMKKQELRDKINELRNPRLLAELNTFEQKKSELNEQISKLQIETSNIDAQTKNILDPENARIDRLLADQKKEKADFEGQIKDNQGMMAGLDTKLKESEKIEKRFYEQFKSLFTDKTKIDTDIKKLDDKLTALFEQERKEDHLINSINLENARVKADLDNLQNEFKDYEGVSLDKQKSEQDLKREISQFENMVQNLGSVNLKALEIYDNVEHEYKNLHEKKKKLETERSDVLLMINEIDTKKKDLFLKTFNVVTENFKNIFSQLSTKGDAYLELENEKEPLAEGVRIKVRLSGKKFLDIRSLSGGEKTMTALAFIFCIQEHEPASFYVLDEVDAALDKKNSEKLAKLVAQYSDRAQYLMITHNDSVVSEGEILYGVSMDEHGVSNVVSLKV